MERYHQGYAADMAAEQKEQQRGEADELGVNGLVNPPALDWDSVEDDEEYYD